MNSSLPRCLWSGLTFVFLMAAGGCGTRSVIGQQTGQGGTSSTGGMIGSGTGGQANQGDGGTPGTGGSPFPGTGGNPFPGTGGSPNTGAGGSTVADGGGTCPTSTGSAGSSGSLSFGGTVDYLTHAGSMLVALGDLNGDGKPDLAVTNYSVPPGTGGTGGSNAGTGGFATGGTPGTTQGSLSVFLSATGGYGPPQSYSVGTNPWSTVVGDLNGDGKADVAVVNDQGVSVFFNSGSGTLLPPVSFATGTGPVWVAIGDLNGDGKADLAVANRGAPNGSELVGGDVAVLLNMGGGTFVAANYPAGASPISVAMADLNGDGKADLAVASGAGVSVLLNNGNGTFGAPASYGSGTNPFSVAAGDLNGDGKLDLAVGGTDRASVLLNLGNGTFAAAVNYSYAATPYNGSGLVVIGDLNGDGRPDLAGNTLTDPCSAVAVLLNQGNGVFGAPSYVPASNSSPSSVTLGDLNGDGKLDLVVPNGDGVAVLLNTTP
jgi:hypothetical protein